MALQATHIRFALDLIDFYQVGNVKSYIVGATYPDSRYLTGLKRELTHPPDFLSWNLEKLSDYQKGQHSHSLCDMLQASLVSKTFPDIFEGKEIEQGNDLWIAITAIKVVQDFLDQLKFDLKSNFPDLNFIENLNGEDKNILRDYFLLIIDTYLTSDPTTLTDYNELLSKLGLSEDSFKKLAEIIQAFASDPVQLKLIEEIYPMMISEAKQMINIK